MTDPWTWWLCCGTENRVRSATAVAWLWPTSPDRPDAVYQHVQAEFTNLSTPKYFIMAMLYLRTTNRELWRAVTEQGSWSAVNWMLRDVPFWEHDVPLFATVASDLSGGQQLVEAVRLFDKIDLDSVGSASMFDALLERVNRDLGRHGGHFTPSSVVSCVVEVLDLQSTNTVYDPSCGSGELLVAAAQRGVKSVSGQAMNGRSLRMTLLNLSMHDSDAELQIGGPEILHGAFASQQFDIVLSNPPFNITLPDDAEQDAWPFEVPTNDLVRD